MKKSLLGLLLAVALVVPAFAEKGDMSINGKVGFGLSNNLSVKDSPMDNANIDYQMNIPVSLTAEYFYEFMNNLSAGIGVNYSFESSTKFEDHGNSLKSSLFNVYLAVKPEAKIDSKIFTSIYAIGQIGVSSINAKDGDESKTADAGIYLGFGAGTTIANQVIVELLCTSSNGKVDTGDGDSLDLQYTAVTLNLGYKFSL